MTQSQITTISRTIATRIAAIAAARYPAVAVKDGNAEVTQALVHGKPLHLRSAAAIRKTALDKIAEGGYSSNRSFTFSDVFETSASIQASRKQGEATDRLREKFTLKLTALQARVIAACKLGKFDTEHTAALDEFETKAEALSASE